MNRRRRPYLGVIAERKIHVRMAVIVTHQNATDSSIRREMSASFCMHVDVTVASCLVKKLSEKVETSVTTSRYITLSLR